MLSTIFSCFRKLSPTLDLTSEAFVKGTWMLFRWEVFSIVLVLYGVAKLKRLILWDRESIIDRDRQYR